MGAWEYIGMGEALMFIAAEVCKGTGVYGAKELCAAGRNTLALAYCG